MEQEAIDVNFAIHFPLLDRLFGTYHLPDKWLEGCGVGDQTVRLGDINQYKYRRQREKAGE